MRNETSLKEALSTISRTWLIVGFTALVSILVPGGYFAWERLQEKEITGLGQSITLAFRPMILSGNSRDAEVQMERALGLKPGERIEILSQDFQAVYPNPREGAYVPACQGTQKPCFENQKIIKVSPVYFGDSTDSELFGYVRLTKNLEIDYPFLLGVLLVFISVFGFLGFMIPRYLSRVTQKIERRIREWSEELLRLSNGETSFQKVSTLPFSEFSTIPPVIDRFSENIYDLKVRLEAEGETKGRLKLLREMNHDLKTPVSILRRFLSVHRSELEEGLEPDLTRLSHMEQCIDRLHTLIGQMKQIGATSAKKQRIDLSGLISEYIGNFSEGNNLKESGSLIRYQSELENSPMVEIDPASLERLLDNLFRNALEAHAKQIEVVLSAENGRLRVSVTDDGIGIQEEAKSKIFNYEFTTKKGKGTGLGLGIVKKLCNELRCEISFTSEREKGTSFFIDFTEVDGASLKEVTA